MSSMKVLIIFGGHMGDMLMTTPLVRFLNKQGHEITYYSYSDYTSILKNNPYITNIFHKTDKLNELYSKFGMVYDLSQIQVETDALINSKKLSGDIHTVDIFFRALGIPCPDRHLDLFFQSDEIEQARNIVISQKGKRIAFVLSATARNRTWSSSLIERTLRILSQQHTVFCLDSKQHALLPGVINLTGITTVRELCAIIKLCDILITPDTGALHIGQALGVPTFATFGTVLKENLQTAPRLYDLYPNKPECSPCRSSLCKYQGISQQENICLNQLTPELLCKQVNNYFLRNATE